MPTIQVKGVPDDVHRILRRRAADRHQSLQEYLLTLLTEEARTPTLDEVLERIGYRSGGEAPLTETAQLVRGDRDRR
jgi:hypothetical protein